MCKLRALTLSKPYDLYDTVSAAGTVITHEPINAYLIIPRIIFFIYATMVIVWSVTDLLTSNIGILWWFAFRINWITLLIWTYFLSASSISIMLNYHRLKRSRSSDESSSFLAHSNPYYIAPSWDDIDNDYGIDDDESSTDLSNYYCLSKLFKIGKICLQISISAIIMLSILYYIDERSSLFKNDDIPEIALNIQLHGILGIMICFDYMISCIQIQYNWGTFYALFFDFASLIWTYLFYHSSLINPYNQSDSLYSPFDWSSSKHYIKILKLWGAATLLHWVVHMLIVYLKFVVVCYWLDARHFTHDIIKEESVIKNRTMDNNNKKNKNKNEQRYDQYDEIGYLTGISLSSSANKILESEPLLL